MDTLVIEMLITEAVRNRVCIVRLRSPTPHPDVLCGVTAQPSIYTETPENVSGRAEGREPEGCRGKRDGVNVDMGEVPKPIMVTSPASRSPVLQRTKPWSMAITEIANAPIREMPCG